MNNLNVDPEKVDPEKNIGKSKFARALSAAMQTKQQKNANNELQEKYDKARETLNNCIVQGLKYIWDYNKTSDVQPDYIKRCIQNTDESFLKEIQTEEDAKKLQMFFECLFESDIYQWNPNYFVPYSLWDFNRLFVNSYLKDFQHLKSITADEEVVRWFLQKFFLLRHICSWFSLEDANTEDLKNMSVDDVREIVVDKELTKAFKDSYEQ